MGIAFDKLTHEQKKKALSLIEVEAGKLKDDPRRIDLTDQHFGEWTVLVYAGKKKWVCICSCGEIRSIRGIDLRNNTTKSCGHENRAADLVGKTFGYWEVIEKVDGRHHKCRCNCGCGGTEKVVLTYDLISGKTKSCGINTTRKESIIGKKFNHWTVLEKAEDGRYKCECDCDEHTIGYVTRADLVSGRSKSCGHNLDSNEKFCIETLLNWIKTFYFEDISTTNGYIYIIDKDLIIRLIFNTEGNVKNIAKAEAVKGLNEGKHIIFIFEHEWNNITKRKIVKELIKNKISADKYKVYAKRCTVQTIGNEVCRKFLNKYHLQGATPAEIRYGIYLDSNLIGVATFGKPRFNPNYEYELIRLAWMHGVNVIGGSEKLFKAFINDYKPTSIVSYCDISKFNGGVYNRLGFKTTIDSITDPNYVWINSENKVLTRYQTMKHKLLEQGLGTPDMTENQIMESLGYFKVYDCGNLKFIWNSLSD